MPRETVQAKLTCPSFYKRKFINSELDSQCINTKTYVKVRNLHINNVPKHTVRTLHVHGKTRDFLTAHGQSRVQLPHSDTVSDQSVTM